MTARHCVSEPGQIVRFKLKSDVAELEGKLTSSESHYALITKISPSQDLALLSAIQIPAQPYLTVSKYRPLIGDKIWITGHGAGLLYTTIQGTVSGYRNKSIDPDLPPVSIYQIQTPLWFGFSGSPVVDSDGELVGVASSISLKIPDTGYVIAVSEIRSFLAGEL